MKKCLSSILAAALTLTLISCGTTTPDATDQSSAGSGSDADVMTIKLATIGPEDGTVQASAEHVLMDYIEQASGGKIKVQYYPNAVLGGDLDLAEGLGNGSIELATLETSVLTAYSDKIGILGIPFLFTDTDAALKALNEGSLGTILADELKGTGILASDTWGFGGYRGLSNNTRAISAPEDMKGLKIRVMESPVFLTSFSLMGANPTPIGFSELFTALQNKTVDGQDNDPSLTYTCKFYEVQKYYTNLEHIMTVTNMFISESWYTSLSEENQEIIQEACRRFAEYCTTEGLASYEDNLDLLEQNGMEVTRLTPEQRQLFKDAVISMYDEYIEKWGQEIFDAAQQYN